MIEDDISARVSIAKPIYCRGIEMELNTFNDDSRGEVAVRVRNAYKRFSTHNVILHGFSMTVPEGTV